MRATEQQHNKRKREKMEKCFECYAENGWTGTGIKALAAACGCCNVKLQVNAGELFRPPLSQGKGSKQCQEQRMF